MQREEPGELLPGDDIAIAGIGPRHNPNPRNSRPVPTEWNIRETSQRETHVCEAGGSLKEPNCNAPGKLPDLQILAPRSGE